MKTQITLQERLRDLRFERHLRLEDLSRKTGISTSALSSYENDDYKEINHGSLIKLARFYDVSVDYLLCLSENRNHPDAELSSLHLSDEMVALLKSGKINNRLLCEIATNEKFEKLMADAEIYVDGIATMRYTDLNSSLEEARAVILEEHPEAAGDRILRTLEAAQIDEEDFFCHVTHRAWDAILHDIRKAHELDAESAPDETPAHSLQKEIFRIARSSGDQLDKFAHLFCQQFGIQYNRLTEDEKSALKGLFKKSKLLRKSPLSFKKR